MAERLSEYKNKLRTLIKAEEAARDQTVEKREKLLDELQQTFIKSNQLKYENNQMQIQLKNLATKKRILQAKIAANSEAKKKDGDTKNVPKVIRIQSFPAFAKYCELKAFVAAFIEISKKGSLKIQKKNWKKRHALALQAKKNLRYKKVAMLAEIDKLKENSDMLKIQQLIEETKKCNIQKKILENLESLDSTSSASSSSASASSAPDVLNSSFDDSDAEN